MKRPDMVKSSIQEAKLVVKEKVVATAEDKVNCDESERLVGPGTGIGRIGDASMPATAAFAGAVLTIFRNPRACKDAKAKPIIDGMFQGEEDDKNGSNLGLSAKEIAKRVNHRQGERFLGRKRLAPR